MFFCVRPDRFVAAAIDDLQFGDLLFQQLQRSTACDHFGGSKQAKAINLASAAPSEMRFLA
jgi:hypothetical protein